MTRSLAYISVGSNIEPQRNVLDAIRLLMEDLTLTAASTFYRTRPLLERDGPDYLNGVLAGSTDIPAQELKLNLLHPIEGRLGRRRTGDTFESRTIDLDLILYDDLVMKTDSLVLPDPDIRTRWFLAIPLLELDPGLLMPDTKEPLSNLPVVKDGVREGRPDPEITGRIRAAIEQRQLVVTKNTLNQGA